MKKRITLTLSLLFVITTSASAQLQLGGQLGFGWYSMSGVNNNQTEANSVFRGNIGFLVFYPLLNNLFLSARVAFISRGMVKSHANPDDSPNNLAKIYKVSASDEMTEDVSLNYIQIPLTVRYEFDLKNKLKPSVILGPTFAFNVSSKNTIEGYGEWDGEYDIGNLRTFDFGGLIGGGISYPVGKFNLFFDIMYERSFISAFSDVTEDELANDFDEELWTETDPDTYERTTKAVDFKNSGFTFQFGATIPLGLNK